MHRRALREGDVTTAQRIPVTTPFTTLVDLAARARADRQVERDVGQADILGPADPEQLRRELETARRRAGARRLARVLDRHTFVLTHSELERLFLAIVRRAGLPLPDGQHHTEAGRVDFSWGGPGLVVETDGLTYHRTVVQQAADLKRDHAHAAAGRRCLRFSHAQIRYEPAYVERMLAAVLEASRPR